MTADQVWLDAQSVGKGDVRDWGAKVQAAISFGFGTAPELYGDLADLDDPDADHTLAVEAALQTAAAQATAWPTSSTGSGGLHFPRCPVFFYAGRRYNTTRKIPVDNARIALLGNRNLIQPLVDFSDQVLEFTGSCEHMLLQGVDVKSTSVGALRWNAANSAGTMCTIDDCEILKDDFGSAVSVGIEYTNRSSILEITNSRSAGLPHFLWNKDCDEVRLNNNNYGNPTGFTYPNAGDGMIRNDRGHLNVQGGLFNGGPDNEGTEMAFIRCGVPGGLSERDHGRVTLSGGLRIGTESAAGGGTGINFYTPHVGAPAGIRPGVDISQILISGDADKAPHHTGIDISAMIRCFKMPHTINVSNVTSATGHLAVVTAGTGGDDLATLRSTTFPGSYQVSGVTGNVYAVRTTDPVEGAEWANNVFNQAQVLRA